MTDALMDIGFSRDLAVLVAKTLGVIVVASFGLLWTLFGIWLERKVAGRFQDCLGPNHVGLRGVPVPAGRGQDHAQGRHHPDRRGQVGFQHRPGAVGAVGHAGVGRRAVQRGLDRQRPEHRRAVPDRRRFAWHHRRDDGRVEQQQQVCAAGRVSRRCAAYQLRDPDAAGAAGARPPRRVAEPARHRAESAHHVPLRRAADRRHLPHFQSGRDGPRALRPAGGRIGVGGRVHDRVLRYEVRHVRRGSCTPSPSAC